MLKGDLIMLFSLIKRFSTLTLTSKAESVFGLVQKIPDSSNEEDTSNGKLHRGFFFLRPTANVLRNIATCAPHPKIDEQSAHMMAELFDHGTRTFSVTGVNRCFSNEKSLCDGKTSVCKNGLETYPISDSVRVQNSFSHMKLLIAQI